METENKTAIVAEFSERRTKLEQEIDHLDNFIIDLKSHKISLEHVNSQLEQLAAQEQDRNKRTKFFVAIRANIELLTKIFNSISELENIKQRYHKELNDVMTNKIKLVEIDIRKLEEGLKNGSENLSEFFEKLGNALSNSNRQQSQQIEKKLDENPDYKL